MLQNAKNSKNTSKCKQIKIFQNVKRQKKHKISNNPNLIIFNALTKTFNKNM